MANQAPGISLDNETRLKFGCSLINKLARAGIIANGDLTSLTTIASFITMLQTKRALTTVNESQKIWLDMLMREVTWLAGLGILTTTIITALATVRGTSATTDLRYNFANNVKSDPNFDAALEEYFEFASGSTAY